jgi:hypothetical protein
VEHAVEPFGGSGEDGISVGELAFDKPAIDGRAMTIVQIIEHDYVIAGILQRPDDK